MAGLKPQILFGKVMHKRLFPKVNSFTYGIYNIAVPLSKVSQLLENKYFKLNRRGFLSFYDKDHGARDSGNLIHWAQDILKKFDVDKADGDIKLVMLPRVFGYVFNPVSFWFCYDQEQQLRAVICEVNNTFGESHSYICAHPDQSIIQSDDVMTGAKVFHVSPFLERQGYYEFRFHDQVKNLGVWITYFDGDGNKKLLTALTGRYEDFTQKSCGKAFWRYPLVTMKAILLIHWQAMKLFCKKAEYVPKPLQNKTKITKVDNK